jgi:2-methylcitrate dehydratase PrpD
MTSRHLIDVWMRSEPLSAPADVVVAAQLHLLDAIGVGLAASAMPAQGAVYRRYAEQSPSGPASSLAGAKALTAADAAMVNGGLIHSLEFDDTHTQSIVHGSSVLAAVALAAGQEAGASGAAILAAYMRGWEALIRIGLAAPGAFQARGFQVTSVGGALVAALIASELMNADTAQCVNSIGIALSQASGVFEFLSNGSSVKSLHPGWAAHAGVVAARLASSGMTGPETAFEGRHGLFSGFAGDVAAAQRFDELLADFGTVWKLGEAAFKLIPCCHYLHSFVEAALALRHQGVAADSIAELVVRIAPGAAAIVCEPWAAKCAPIDGHAARWSLPIVVAEALVYGHADLETFSRPAGGDVRALALRCRMEPLQPNRFPQCFEAEIECVLHSGATRQFRVSDALGNASRPASRDVVIDKFRSNAGRALSVDGVARAEAALLTLDQDGALAELADALRARRFTEQRI